ncbi:MAG: ADP-ribosylglycohydrolase family protein [Gammaproteobacteria bacterium]|jgi:poly(ADP-ribose) glycohydrolase ARH3|nr:ADP-ribosylglycohydrolase family protein [Gammaproteobacteria bacterium]
MSAGTLHACALGAMYGCALGDALGELAFRGGDRTDLLRHAETEPVLRHTENTLTMIAVAETLIEFGDVEPQILGNRLQDYYRQERWRGYGGIMREIGSMVASEGIGYIDAAARMYEGSGSLGNGAGCRVLPLVLHFTDTAALERATVTATRVTHAHPIAIDGARILAAAEQLALEINPQRPFAPEAFAAALVPWAQTREMVGRLESLLALLKEGATTGRAAQVLGLGNTMLDSLPYALYCFLIHPHEFIECVLAAVLQGGDRDTIGALAGTLSGAFLGVTAIPASWRARLENTQRIESLALELAARGAPESEERNAGAPGTLLSE